MGTPLHIALRYLFAKKSHNVINIISIISAAGIAIGSMALILILSVYNGFDNSIKKIYESYKADFVIEPLKGKTFTITPDNITQTTDIKGVLSADPILEETVFVKYGNRESIATIRGISEDYTNHGHISGNITEGEAKMSHGEIRHAIVGEQLARSLGVRVRFVTPLEVFFPKKEGNISISNPMESLRKAALYPSSIMRMDAETSENILYAEEKTVRELTGNNRDEYSYMEIYLEDEMPSNHRYRKECALIQKELEKIFPQCTIKDREQQNETLYKMMKAEKFAVYLILFFVIAIISVNIFSSLSMLITDKKEDIGTFLSMGATNSLVRKIFHLHGFIISFAGCLIGVITGLLLAFIQQQTGIVSMPGNYIVSAYPVEIRLTDIIITISGVSAAGYIISLLPIGNFFKK